MLKRFFVMFAALLAVFWVGTVWAGESGPQLPDGAQKILPSKVTDPQGRVIFDGQAPPRPEELGIELPDKPERGLYTTLESKGARLGLYGNENFVPFAKEIILSGKRLRYNRLSEVLGALPSGVSRDLKGYVSDWRQDTQYLFQPGKYEFDVKVYVDARRFWSFLFDVVVQDFDFYLKACLDGDNVQLQYLIQSIGKIPTKVGIEVPEAMSGFATVQRLGTGSGLAVLPVSKSAYDEFLAGQELDTVITDVSLYPGRKATLPVYYPNVEWLGSCGGSGGGGGKG